MKLKLGIMLIFSCQLFSQSLKEFETEVESNFDFGIEVQNEWKKRNELLKNLDSGKKKWDDLTDKESKLFEKYDETYESMWDVGGGGCSWYCGAGNYNVKVSSFFKSNKKNNYAANNIHDFNYKTAWVEGSKGYGIDEYVEFEFVPENPRVTVIKIANGYVKNKKAWTNNSRVKKMKMYVDGKEYGIINLKDIYSLQSVKLDKPIGYSDRKDMKKLKELPKWKIKFKILEVYKGNKFSDTVISEIFFDGIDVH